MSERGYQERGLEPELDGFIGRALGRSRRERERGRRRVVITGMGALTPLGDTVEELGEGLVAGRSGILILESLEHALSRGATILAELVGFGVSSDAYHIVAPDAEGQGAARAMRWALEDAGIPPQAVDYVNAHGTSTPLNDAIETLAIKKVFGDHAVRLAVSSTKSMIGHLLRAAGAVEAIATIKTLVEGVIHPTINYEEPDPQCDLDYVPNVARRQEVRVAISNSFGFGGQNACLVLQRYPA